MRLNRVLPKRDWLERVHPARRLRRAAVGLIQLVFPPRCPGCDGELPDRAPAWTLCDACRTRLAPSAALRCERCGEVALHPVAADSTGDALGCNDCRER